MTRHLWPRVLASLSMVLAGNACEVRHSDDGTGSGEGSGSGDDGGGSTGDTTDGGGTGGDGSSGGGTGEPCPEGEIYVYPGCGGEGDIMPEAGCYERCEGPDYECSEGACQAAVIDPCVCPGAEECCDACGAEAWLCLPGAGLPPGFEQELVHQDGCGDISLYAWNDGGSVALGVGIYKDLIAQAQADGTQLDEVVELPDPDAHVEVLLGPGVSQWFCNDAIEPGPDPVRYVGQGGTITLSVTPTTPDQDPVQGIVSAHLEAVELEPELGGDPVTVAEYDFADVAVWCCPG